MQAAYEALLTGVTGACRQHYGDRLRSVAVYGSVARGMPRPDSDVDLLIVAYLAKEAYSDVVREAQQVVELALKGMLRQVGMEPPHWHDVGRLIRQHRDRFPGVDDGGVDRLVEISTALRKERELAFYGAIDFIPTDEYTREHAGRRLATPPGLCPSPPA